MRAGIISKFKMVHDGSSAELSRLCKSVLSDGGSAIFFNRATSCARKNARMRWGICTNCATATEYELWATGHLFSLMAYLQHPAWTPRPVITRVYQITLSQLRVKNCRIKWGAFRFKIYYESYIWDSRMVIFFFFRRFQSSETIAFFCL